MYTANVIRVPLCCKGTRTRSVRESSGIKFAIKSKHLAKVNKKLIFVEASDAYY